MARTHFAGDEAAVQRKKRHTRASKKKRLQLKKRASLEPEITATRTEMGNQQDQQKQEQTQKEKDALQRKGVQEQDTEEPHQQEENIIDDLNQRQDREQTQAEDPIHKKDGSGHVEHDQEMSNYESRRRKNILRNQNYMEQVGISNAKYAARTVIGNEAEKEARRQELAKKRALRDAARTESLPIRKSRRLQGKIVDTQPDDRQYVWLETQTQRGDVIRFLKEIRVDPPEQSKPEQSKPEQSKPKRSKHRPRTGKRTHRISKENKEFLKELTGDSKSDDDAIVDAEDEVKYSLAEDDVVKVSKEQIHCVTFHPSAERVVVACGDENGDVALWSPSSGPAIMKHKCPASRIITYRPRRQPVRHLIFSDSSKLLSASNYGSIREFDLCGAESSLVFQPSSRCRLFSLVAASNPQCLYSSWDDGSVRLIDRRVEQVHSARYRLHKLRANTVHQHPSLEFCIATASEDKTVCLWDVRKLSANGNTPLTTLPHSESVHCAYFSPRDGTKLVTVTDSYGNLFDTSSLTKCEASPTSIRFLHSNQGVTNVQAAWSPRRPIHFLLGGLDQPRIQFFRTGYHEPVRELKSDDFDLAHSINLFHPHRDLIASGNSAGELALWRGR